MTLKPIQYPDRPHRRRGSHVEASGKGENPDPTLSVTDVLPFDPYSPAQAASPSSHSPVVPNKPHSPELLTPVSTPDKVGHHKTGHPGLKDSQPGKPFAPEAPKIICSLATINNSRYLAPNKMALCGSPEVYHNFDIRLDPPFLDPTNTLQDCKYGVLKVMNIPFTVTIQEIRHFIGRFAQGSLLAPHINGYPIHIIIERSTGKTMDCYIEFMTQQDAAQCLARIENTPDRFRHLRIGQRQIHVDMSTQGEFLSNLFIRSKCVQWDAATGKPKIVPNTDRHSEGFRGFFTVEEMASIVKHAQVPQRSPFTSHCMQRPYESMISTLYKFPWLTTNRYTIAARDYLFCTYSVLLDFLVRKVHPEEFGPVPFYLDVEAGFGREVGLSHSLLMDFLFAGLNTPTFSLRQKFHVVANCGLTGHGFSLSRHAFSWPFQVLSPPYGTPDLVIEFWLKIMSDGFDIMTEHGLSHGLETYVQVERDNHGAIGFTFTTPGNNLQWKEGVVVEKRVMDQFIEKGRTKWCIDHGIAYQPARQRKPSRPYVTEPGRGMMVPPDLNWQTSKGQTCRPGSSRDDDSTVAGEDSSDMLHGGRLNFSLPASWIVQGPSDTGEPASHNPRSDLPGQPLATEDLPDVPEPQFTIDPTTPEFVPAGERAHSGHVAGSAVRLGKPGAGTFSLLTRRMVDAAVSRLYDNQSTQNGVTAATNTPTNGGSVASDQVRSTFSNGSASPLATESRQSPGEKVRNYLYGETLSNNYDSHFSSTEMQSAPDGPVARRRTINIDTTIHEEAEDSQFHHHGGIARSGSGVEKN